MINRRLYMVSGRVVRLSLKPQSVMITHRYLLLVMNGLKILHQTEHPVDLSIPDMYLRYLSRNLKTESITSHNLQPTTQIILTKLRDNVKNISHLMKPNKIFYKISLVTLSESIPKIVLRLQLV